MKHLRIAGKEKGVIVFIHGNSSSSDVFENILNSSLVNQTKIAVQLPGHKGNLADYHNLEDFSMKAYCDELIPMLNNLNEDILLVGNSLGGHIAIEISKKIKRLKGLVIFGSPPLKKPANFAEAFLPLPELQTFFTKNPTDNEIEMAAKVAVYNKDYYLKIVEDFKIANPLVRAAIGNDSAENKLANEFEIFTSLNISKFIIAGEFDPSPSLDYLQVVKNECNCKCEVIVLNDCGHYPSLERPNEFSKTLKEIVEQVF